MNLIEKYNHAIILSIPEQYNNSILKELDEFYDGPEGPNDNNKCGGNNSTGELGTRRFNESNYDKEEVTKYYSCMSSIEDLNKTDNSASYNGFRTSTPIESSNVQPMCGVDKFGSMSTIYQDYTSSDIPLRESDFQFTEESYSEEKHSTLSSLESNLQNLQGMIDDKDNLAAAKIPSWVFSNTDTPLKESDFENYDDSYIEKKPQQKKHNSTPTEFCWQNLKPLFENNDNGAVPTTGDNFSDDDFPLSRSEFDGRDSFDSFMKREHQALMAIIGRAFSNPPNHNNDWSNNFDDRNTDERYKDNEYCSKPLTLF